jgi:multidrug efflux pump subunit AcrB
MPLMIASGAGAGARRSMGTGVVGGMLVATFIATIFIPVFFVLVARRRKARHAAETAPAE